MMLEKLSNFANDARTIGLFLLMIIAAAAWAGDQRYLTISAADMRDVQRIRREIADLEIRKSFAESAKERKMYETLIKVKENQIKSVRGE